MSRPRPISETVNIAQDFDFSTTRPLISWLRAAKMLVTEAAACERDGDLQQAYLYLYRHADLVIGKLPLHPERAEPRYKADLAEARNTVNSNFLKLESWKPRIEREWQRWQRATERRKQERRRVQEQRDGEAAKRLSWDLEEESGSDQGQVEALNAAEHSQLAIGLARDELRRRKGVGTHDGVEGDLRQGLQSVRRQLDYREPLSRGSGSQAQSASAYNYPSVPHAGQQKPSQSWQMPPLVPTKIGPAPPRPAKEAYRRSDEYSAPHVPSKTSDRSMATPSPPAEAVEAKYTFAPAARTEAGVPLRTLFLPPDLRHSFMDLARSNNDRNLETCGILCGTSVRNALFITHLILPAQTSTSDTCDTTESGDNALFNYCDEHELLVCGWIHTHPTQSCFLSSRDLHTSSGYQVMLPEAIAIVCAPQFEPEYGIFRLTDPPGLPHVLQCHKPGIFHPHEVVNLYTDALRPGHVVQAKGLEFEVVDLTEGG